MNGSADPRHKHALLLSALLGGVVLTSCETGMENRVSAPPSAPAILSQKTASTANLVDEAQRQPQFEPQVSRTQLIKKAALTLVVNSLDKSIQEVLAIAKQHQGDLLGLEDQKSPNNSARHTVSIQIRVPQNQLDTTLDKLTTLGSVQSRTITAEDVADQLVDNQARLRNLQKTESTLLGIMQRSGSVGDVLKVAQELSNVRQSIEQINAQLKSLQNQIAYSTITLKLEAAVSTTTSQRSLNSEVQETWNNSTYSLREFSFGLLRLGIWLIVYSPYLLLFGATIYGYTRLRKPNSRSINQVSEPPNTD
ncbi:MAG: DUF4349 domain-containing protein [Gloeocapsa sp. UFS-A4-WI-NPMV-4B04]|jgi:hypothetical protein|nr:DUF4349 domain-containing protein [Gloeocapsa sp. UFS-A4-WI-NPMV-4B04]